MTIPAPEMDIVAIVLARGGSKGVPRKNLIEVGGRPLIEHTLERARAVQAISHVFVSTDSQEIADVASRLGAEIVWRPAELCGDRASSESGLLHCLDHIRTTFGANPRLVVFLQPTSPLRSDYHIERAIALLEKENADSLFSAGPLQGLAWRVEAHGVAPVSYDPRRRVPRQEAPDYLAENGSIYVFKPWVLREEGCRLGGRIVAFQMDAQDSFEVDEVDDIPVIDFLLRQRYPELVSDMDRMSVLSGKKCLITGASGGLGVALAREFGRHHCRLILSGRDHERLESVTTTLRDEVRVDEVIPADLRSESDRVALIAKIEKRVGGIDILVNNAGVFSVGEISVAHPSELEECLTINLTSPLLLCRAFAAGMISRGWGRIVNIASSSAYEGFASTAAYCASKHGLLGLSRALDDELRSHGVRVIVVSPGSIKTEMGRKVPGQAFETFMTPEEVAAEIVHATALNGSLVVRELRLVRMVMG